MAAKKKVEDLSAFDEAPVVNSDALSVVIEKASELVNVTRQIEDITQLLEKLNSRAHELKTNEIPAKMATAGLREFTLPAGHRIEIEDFVAAAFPKKKDEKERVMRDRIEALADMPDGSALIKTEMVVVFEKRQHNQALTIADQLRKKGLNVSVDSGVNAQSFKAYIREKLRGGDPIDQKKLGVFVGVAAKLDIVRPGESAKKGGKR